MTIASRGCLRVIEHNLLTVVGNVDGTVCCSAGYSSIGSAHRGARAQPTRLGKYMVGGHLHLPTELPRLRKSIPTYLEVLRLGRYLGRRGR